MLFSFHIGFSVKSFMTSFKGLKIMTIYIQQGTMNSHLVCNSSFYLLFPNLILFIFLKSIRYQEDTFVIVAKMIIKSHKHYPAFDTISLSYLDVVAEVKGKSPNSRGQRICV